MPSKIAEQHQEKLDNLKSIVESENKDGFGGGIDGERFLIWASQSYFQFMDDPPSIEELLDRKTDGRDDLGLDLYYVDDDEEVVYLVQSKFRSQYATVKRAEIDSFLSLPNKLVDRKMLGVTNNTRVLQFAFNFKDLVSKGFELRLVYLTTERVTKQINGNLKSWNEKTLNLVENRPVAHHAEIIGVDELLDSYSTSYETTTTTLQFIDWYISENTGDSLRYLNGSVRGDELARAFDKHKFKIFRLNPRGPLGSTKVNKEIRETLSDDVERSRFYFLNNGLTAVCESFSANKTKRTATIRDLQIVNGCQTTWNIYEHKFRGGSLEGVTVNVKLIEVTASADTISMKISQASNSQSQMKDWDFLFNEPEQIQLQKEFEKLDDPIFYELKRGEQRYITSSRLRKTTIKDVAQAMWAFIGYPGEAKDKLREIARNYKSDNSAYRNIFFDGVTAKHLVLPMEIHNRVKQEWKKSQETSDSAGRSHDVRLYIVWLIGQLILKATQTESYKDIDAQLIDTINSRIDGWFSYAYEHAGDAIKDTHDYLIPDNANGQVTERQLFRSPQYYDRFKEDLDRVMRYKFDDFQEKVIGNGVVQAQKSFPQERLVL